MATITSVTFNGSQRTPTIVVTGTGFGTAPATAASPAGGRQTGSNYGTSLHIADRTSNFSAGLTDPLTTDFVGLTNLSYTDTAISFQLGSAYARLLYNFRPGDTIGITVAGAEFVTTATFNPPITTQTLGVARFFDTRNGTHFFTASQAEVVQVLATRPDLQQEGTTLTAVDPAGNDPNAIPVYRFFDTVRGTHFFTSSQTERDTVTATRPDLRPEGIGLYEHATQQAGDQAVYRFFDTTFGTHFYSTSTSENATILATRPDLRPEGISFYAPT